MDAPRIVLDLGCGLGEIARRMAPRLERVDALDPSGPMLDSARALPGGTDPRIRWIHRAAEDFVYPHGYALVVAAQSLHWMDWERVMPALGASLSPRGMLAIVIGHPPITAPWWRALRPLIPEYSTTRDYDPYDLVEELAIRELFHLEGRVATRPVSVRQPVDEYIESWHARNGFSRDRMSKAGAAELDERIRRMVEPFAPAGHLSYDVWVDVAWGVPAAGRASP